jgi:HIRAN domain
MPRLSLTRSQLATAAGAELAQLLEEVTADGKVDERELNAIADWLLNNQHHQLPAIDHLLPVIHRITQDNRVTLAELAYLQKEIETVLPPELRRAAQLKRREAAKFEREKALAEADAAKREFALSAPVMSFDFMVAGVAYDGRAALIEERAGEIEGAEVYLARMPDNPYDKNAISVLLHDDADLGYMPRRDAAEITVLLDKGYRYTAVVKNIIPTTRYRIPVIMGKLFAPDHPRKEGLLSKTVKYGFSKSQTDDAGSNSFGSGMLFFALIVLAVIVFVALFSK